MSVNISLHCTIYVSKIALSERSQLQKTVRSILTQAQHCNARDDITGLLVFNNLYFAQALEGDPAAIEKTLGRISKDVRHTLPSIVLRQPIAERSFGAWTMCARQLSTLDNAILDRLEERGAFSPAQNSGRWLLEQLQGIGRVHQAAFDKQLKDVAFL